MKYITLLKEVTTATALAQVIKKDISTAWRIMAGKQKPTRDEIEDIVEHFGSRKVPYSSFFE